MARGGDAWIRDHVEVTGEIEQPHVYWWSTVLRVPTADGVVWFKARPRATASSRRSPKSSRACGPSGSSELVDVDFERGWMLTRRRGRPAARAARLRGRPGPLGGGAAAVRGACSSPSRRTRTGCSSSASPTSASPGFADPLRAACSATASGCSSTGRTASTIGQLARLVASVPEVERLCTELAAVRDSGDGPARRPPRRQRLRAGRPLRLLRLGRQLRLAPVPHARGHAPRDRVAVRSGARRASLLRLRDAYLEPFGAYGSRPELVAAVASSPTARDDRACTLVVPLCGRCGRSSSDDDSDSVPYGLKLFLENGPIGTWQ